MESKKYLTEENYKRGKKKIKTIALVILVVGLLIGGSLIATGLMKQEKVNSQYSEDNKTTISQQLETEKQNLISKKAELEAKIQPIETQVKKLKREKTSVFMNGGFSDRYYEIEDEIEELEKSIITDKNSIDVINNALDESSALCDKNNNYTSKYCSLKLQLDDFTDFNKEFDSSASIPFYMFGAFVIIATCMIAGSIYTFSKRREIAAFTAQQVMPVAKEVTNETAPTIGNAAGEIAKGIKNGLKDEEKYTTSVKLKDLTQGCDLKYN